MEKDQSKVKIYIPQKETPANLKFIKYILNEISLNTYDEANGIYWLNLTMKQINSENTLKEIKGIPEDIFQTLRYHRDEQTDIEETRQSFINFNSIQASFGRQTQKNDSYHTASVQTDHNSKNKKNRQFIHEIGQFFSLEKKKQILSTNSKNSSKKTKTCSKHIIDLANQKIFAQESDKSIEISKLPIVSKIKIGEAFDQDNKDLKSKQNITFCKPKIKNYILIPREQELKQREIEKQNQQCHLLIQNQVGNSLKQDQVSQSFLKQTQILKEVFRLWQNEAKNSKNKSKSKRKKTSSEKTGFKAPRKKAKKNQDLVLWYEQLNQSNKICQSPQEIILS